MRLFYLLIGYLLGIYIASNAGLQVTAVMDKEFEKERLASILTGMSEGWERGRDYTRSQVRFILGNMVEQLDHCQENITKCKKF
jgi:hypothetical protein